MNSHIYEFIKCVYIHTHMHMSVYLYAYIHIYVNVYIYQMNKMFSIIFLINKNVEEYARRCCELSDVYYLI